MSQHLMLITALLFVASLALLVAAARTFTVAAERVGLALGMSPFAVGVLIVSVGTSLPELVTSVVAASTGSSEIVAGNVVGANISNLMLVLAAVAMATPNGIRLGEQYLLVDLHFLVGSTFLLLLSMLDGYIGAGEGIVLLVAYALYSTYLLSTAQTVSGGPGELVRDAVRGRVRFWDVIVMSGGAAGIYVGARYTVQALELLAGSLRVPPSLLAVTLLSLGTTLPELVVSAAAARMGKPDVAVGNILGSCVFNSLGVMGVAAVVGGVRVSPEILRLPAPVFAAGALLFYLLTLDKRVSRWEGALMALFYLLFILELVHLV